MTPKAKTESGDAKFNWYAVRVRSRLERVVSGALENKGYHVFLPLCRQQRSWSDRVKRSEVPLFPGYVFCRLDPQYRLPVLTVPGVVQILGHGRTPLAIPEHEIAAVKTILKSELPYSPSPSLVLGQAVVVDRGPLMGIQGTLVEMRQSHRLLVSVELLRRAVAIDIDASCVKPAAVPPFARAIA